VNKKKMGKIYYVLIEDFIEFLKQWELEWQLFDGFSSGSTDQP